MSISIINARIWTAEREHARAASLRIDDGVISSIDDFAHASAASTVIDAAGRFVCPGLIDTHTHLVMAGETLMQLDLSGARSREAFERGIATRAAQVREEEWDADDCGIPWLIAFGWHEENWGGGSPDRSWLASAGDIPAVAWRMDSHACVINDAAIAMLGDALRGDDPPGGRIGRDARGEPSGLCVEAAAWQIVIPAIPPQPVEARRRALLLAQRHAHRFGITTLGSMEYAATLRDVIDPLRDELSLRVMITLLDREMPLDFGFAESFPSSDRLAIIGFKAFLDGTLGSRTARMLEPYRDDPSNRGLWVELAERGELRAWAEAVIAHGFQPAMHAIGDGAVRLALDTLEGLPRTTRPRIEHAQFVHDDDLARFEGVTASMQPLHRADDARFVEKCIVPEALPRFFRFRSLVERGVTLAFGSDWPIVSCDPVLGIRAAVSGLTTDARTFQQQECIAIEETLRAYTVDAAAALRCESICGSLARGKAGDLVMFDRDFLSHDWADPNARLPRAVLTLAGGIVVHDESFSVLASSPSRSASG